jgi:hypothetical protein
MEVRGQTHAPGERDDDRDGLRQEREQEHHEDVRHQVLHESELVLGASRRLLVGALLGTQLPVSPPRAAFAAALVALEPVLLGEA